MEAMVGIEQKPYIHFIYGAFLGVVTAWFMDHFPIGLETNIRE